MRDDDGRRLYASLGVAAYPVGDIGWGLFAERDFEEGEVIYHLDLADETQGMIIPWEDSFGDCDERVYTFAPGYAYCCTPETPFWYFNHSCNPNAGFKDWGRIEGNRYIPMVAHRPIKRGSQITGDYSFFTTCYDGNTNGDLWEMSGCLCGADNCRRTITSFCQLPVELQVEAVLPEGQVQGRVLAHVVKENRELVKLLQEKVPALYQQYLDVLQEQMNFLPGF